LEGVRTVLAQDAELQQLVRVPLMLNIVSLTYHDKRPEELRGVPPQEQRHRLFDRYVERMLERPRKPEQLEATTPPRYTPEQTKHWLRWLAGRLYENNETVFQMELMQPWWLGRWWQRGLYVFGSMLITGVGYSILGALFGLVLSLIFLLGLEGLIWILPEADVSVFRIQNNERAAFLAFGLLCGSTGGLVVGLGISLSVGLGQWVSSHRHNWYALTAVPLSVGLTVLFGWIFSSTSGELLWWMIFTSAPIGLTASVLLWRSDIRPTERLHWSWNIVRKRWNLGLIIGLIFGLVGILGGGLGGGLGFGLSNGLSGGLVGLLLSGLTSSEVQTKVRPSEGIWYSLHHAFTTWLGSGLVGGLMVVLVSGLLIGLGFESGHGVVIALVTGIIISLGFGPAASLYFGGLAFVQHFVLRLLCALSGYVPWNYPCFLNYAAERILLRRVGGRYIFVHRMLLEYFVNSESAPGRILERHSHWGIG
jgi:hypothetical protein